ncbi:unnamed protein product [Cuscuta campestris]|uniref:Uncharacterized protein n=1 Tax=Cuscuta campestris TaxID=132261 RepID=A0A484KHV2_9ASTE|nr:unnamed protein product [Cuscuta campestris]
MSSSGRESPKIPFHCRNSSLNALIHVPNCCYVSHKHTSHIQTSPKDTLGTSSCAFSRSMNIMCVSLALYPYVTFFNLMTR